AKATPLHRLRGKTGRGTKVRRAAYRMSGAGWSEKQTAVRERQTAVKERGIMKKIESLVRGWIPSALCVAVISLVAGVPAWADGVTICAVYAKDKTPGRCHHGGVSSEPMNWSWRGHRAKINFDVQVPRGVRFNAMTTNGSVHCVNLDSVVQAETTNGNVEVSTSEW